MSNRNARNQLQEGYSLKASDEVHDDAVYDEVDTKGRYESKKETEFIDSAHYMLLLQRDILRKNLTHHYNRD